MEGWHTVQTFHLVCYAQQLVYLQQILAVLHVQIARGSLQVNVRALCEADEEFSDSLSKTVPEEKTLNRNP